MRRRSQTNRTGSPAETTRPAGRGNEVQEPAREHSVQQTDLETQNEELRRTQAELEVARDRYVSLYQQAPIAYVTLGVNGDVLEANQMATALLGVPMADLVHRRLVDFVAPNQSSLLQESFTRLLGGASRQSLELTIVPAGSRATRSVTIEMTLVIEDDTPFCRAALIDITEMVRMREGVARSEAYLAEAQRLTHTGSWAYAPGKERPRYWSAEMSRIFGRDPHDAPPTRAESLNYVDPDDRQRFLRDVKRASRQRADYTEEYRIVLPDGTVRHLQESGHPVLDERGELVEYVGTTMDVTERKYGEDARSQAEQLFWNILDHAPDAMFLYDTRTERIVDVNRSAWESLGYEREELIGKTPRDFDPNVMQDETFLLRTNERVLGGEIFSFETRHRRKDGAEFPVEVRVRRFEYGDRRFVLAQVRDITERKAAEQEHRAYLWFLESMERVSRAMQATSDFEQMVNDVLEVVLDVFECDRTVLGTYAGEPELTSFTVAARRERPGFESPDAPGVEYPIDEDFQPLPRALKAAADPRQYSATSKPPLPRTVTERSGLQAVLSMPLRPKLEERDYFFMLGQCSRPRTWTADEVRLFREIGLRLGDTMVTLSMLRTLRQSEARLEEAERIAHVGWWERDLRTNQVHLSDEVRRIFGLEQADVRHWGQQHWFDLIHPEDRPRALKATTGALRGNSPYDIEYRLIRPDGALRVVHSHGEVKRDDARRAVRLFGILQDVTELRRAEEELRASEARFRTFVDHATDGFFLHDGQLTVVDVNRHACDSLGYRREELIGMQPHDFDVGLDEASIVRISERVDAGETVTFESVHRRKDGTRFPVEVRVRRFPSGERNLRLSLVRDVTERRRAEQRMLAQHAVARLLSMARSMDDAGPRILQEICEILDWDLGTLWGIDPETDVLRCTQLWRKPSVVVPEFEAATWACAFRRGVGLPGRVWASRAPACIPDVVLDRNFLRADAAGREGLHAAFAFPIMLGGEVLGVIDFLSREVRRPDRDLLDIMATIGSQIGQFIERKRAEAALQAVEAELTHVARVTTMGELTASIAHEVNQPLGAMVTSAAACKRWLAADPPQMERAQRALERIVSDGNRAGQVIGRVRSLLKRQAPRKDWLDVNETIQEVVALTQDQARRHDVVLRVALADGLAPVQGDRVQLQQVLLNLIVNAIEAMSGIENRLRELTVVTLADGRAALSVEVRDTGPGVDPARAEKLFEAFYTTKPEGIGMGLSISRSIVEAHGGRLSARPNQPHGAVFLISLPLEDSPP